jgi:hypothetical protein
MGSWESRGLTVCSGKQTDQIIVSRILIMSNLIGHTVVSRRLFYLITFLYEVVFFVRILLWHNTSVPFINNIVMAWPFLNCQYSLVWTELQILLHNARDPVHFIHRYCFKFCIFAYIVTDKFTSNRPKIYFNRLHLMEVIEWVTPWLSRQPVLPIVHFLIDAPLIHPGCHDVICFPVVVSVRYALSAKEKFLDVQYEVKKERLTCRTRTSVCLSVCMWANIDNKILCSILVKDAIGDLGKSWPESLCLFWRPIFF